MYNLSKHLFFTLTTLPTMPHSSFATFPLPLHLSLLYIFITEVCSFHPMLSSV
ncbi:hypothetical protein Hdeb2414_s0017g00506841 [Helianthus debilis subsp. tardiflorus]